MRKGEGSSLLRGYRRLGLRFFPSDVQPYVQAYNSAVDYKVACSRRRSTSRTAMRASSATRLALRDRPCADRVVLDRTAAGRAVVAALADPSTEGSVELPVKVDPPQVTAAQLVGVRRRAERVVSAPVTLKIGIANFVVERRQLAKMLRLPQAGSTKLAFGGPAANAYFERLDREVSTPAQDADFVVGSDGTISISPAKQGHRAQRAEDGRRPACRGAAGEGPHRADRRRALRSPSARPRRRGRWGSPASSARTRRSTAASRTASTTCSSSPR